MPWEMLASGGRIGKLGALRTLVGKSGDVLSLRFDPSATRMVSNFARKRLIPAMCKLVSFSLGDVEFSFGQRTCWATGFCLGTLTVGLPILAEDVVSERLKTAMMRKVRSEQWALEGKVNHSKRMRTS